MAATIGPFALSARPVVTTKPECAGLARARSPAKRRTQIRAKAKAFARQKIQP